MARFKRHPREAVANTVTVPPTGLPVAIPNHGEVWGDLSVAVPKVSSATDEDHSTLLSYAQGNLTSTNYSDNYKIDPPEYVGVVRQQCGARVSRSNGESALVGAARRGATEAVRALLGAGATVNVASANGETALDAATAKGQLSVALALAHVGATASMKHDRLLRVATLRGDDELTTQLLCNGAPPFLKQLTATGEPPLLVDEEEPGATSCLLLAARHPMGCILKTYIDFLATGNTIHTALEEVHGTRCVTVLMVAAVNGSRDDARAAKALLTAGCSPFVADAAGRSALHRAAAAGSREAVAALAVAARSRVGPAAYRAFLDGREACGLGRTALHCAAAVGAATVVAALLMAGADATVVDVNQASPLANAVVYGQFACARQLLAMTDAVLDGDLDICVTLAKQGNWPVDLRVELMINAQCSSSNILRGSTPSAAWTGPAPLEAAARCGNISVVCALVDEAGADATRSGDISPLAAAAAATCLTICGDLVMRGAQPAAALTDRGASLIRAACVAGDGIVIRRMLRALGPDDLDFNNLRAPLHAAASRADDDAVDALLAFGLAHELITFFLNPNPDKTTKTMKQRDGDYLVKYPEPGDFSEPALLAACRTGGLTCVAALACNGSLQSALDGDKRCALHHVAACDHALLVERLCSIDASLVSCRDAQGSTSLHAAAATGAGAAIGALLRHGANATLQDMQKRTPREVAFEYGQPQAAAQLDAMADAIDDGDFEECGRLADAGNWPVDWYATSGDTALVAAARRGAPDAVSRLLTCGAAVDAATERGSTPLAAAAAAGHLDVCAALLAAGADPTKVVDRSASLLSAAVVADEPELVDALIARGASARPVTSTTEPTGAFLVAIELGSSQIVDSFLHRAVATGALNVDEPHGDTHIRALHAAAARGRADIVENLLKAGAQVDVLDAAGKSALHYAASHDHDDVLRVLVSKGANVLHRDVTGSTPLALAIAHGAKSAESALLMAEYMLHPAQINQSLKNKASLS